MRDQRSERLRYELSGWVSHACHVVGRQDLYLFVVGAVHELYRLDGYPTPMS